MTQNRDAPAYQEYAAAILAQIPFRTMALQDRGLLFTMRLECWVNGRLPSISSELAKVLGLPSQEVYKSLPVVMAYFEIVDGFIICPELENYRTHLAERKLKQSKGGKLGSAITNSKNKRTAQVTDDKSSNSSTKSSSNSRLPRRGAVESSVQSRTEKPSQNHSPEREVLTDPFVIEYENAESCSEESYSKASGGR